MLNFISDGPYTCPLLMKAQSILLRQKWRYGSSGWIVIKSKHSKASCMWPNWMVLIECRFWNSRLGARIESMTGGSKTREERLRGTWRD